MPRIFPPEIEEIIINCLAVDDIWFSAMKTCSLVCKAFLHICRKHIYRYLIVNNGRRDGNCPPHPHLCVSSGDLENLLRETPEIADYIRGLTYDIPEEDLTNESIQESLKRISKLRDLHINYGCNSPLDLSLDWSNNPLRPALLHLLHNPTLTHFGVNECKNFVVSDFIPCTNLKSLDLQFESLVTVTTFPAAYPEHPAKLEVLYTHEPNLVITLSQASRPDGQPIIDFSSLGHITVFMERDLDCVGSIELFKDLDVLTEVTLFRKSYLNLIINISNAAPILVSEVQAVELSLTNMLRASMESLLFITVNVWRDSEDVEPLFSNLDNINEEPLASEINDIFDYVFVDKLNKSRPEGYYWGKKLFLNLKVVFTDSLFFGYSRRSFV